MPHEYLICRWPRLPIASRRGLRLALKVLRGVVGERDYSDRRRKPSDGNLACLKGKEKPRRRAPEREGGAKSARPPLTNHRLLGIDELVFGSADSANF
jgi:hypothetical protein